jgi:hypothetical protein
MAVLPRSQSNQSKRSSLMAIMLTVVAVLLGLLVVRSAVGASTFELNGNFAPINSGEMNGNSISGPTTPTTSTVASAPAVELVPDCHSNNSGADFRLYFIREDGISARCDGNGKFIQVIAYYIDYTDGGKSKPGFSFMMSDLAEYEAGPIVQVGSLAFYKLPSGEYQVEHESRGKTRVVIFNASGIITSDSEQ